LEPTLPVHTVMFPWQQLRKRMAWRIQEQKRLKEAGLPYKKRVWCVGCARLNHPGAIMWERRRYKQEKREKLVNKLATGTASNGEFPTAFRIFYKTALPRIQDDPAMYVNGKAPRSGQLMKKVKGKQAVCPQLCHAVRCTYSALQHSGRSLHS
jgi:hypothetical protein